MTLINATRSAFLIKIIANTEIEKGFILFLSQDIDLVSDIHIRCARLKGPCL